MIFRTMSVPHHNNPTLSIIFGALLGLFSYVTEHGILMIDFSLDLLKVCLFGFAGGIFGKIGNRFWTEYNNKNKKS